MEEWKQLYGYEEIYSISNLGNIMNKKRKILQSRTDSKNKYMLVRLYKDKKIYSHLLHRLVALTFIPNDNNLEQVNHIDGIITNNCLSNLEWCSRSNNIKHAWKLGLNKERGCCVSKTICAYKGDNELFFNSLNEAILYFNKEKGFAGISNCLIGRSASSLNYNWKYIQ
jgi:hypothetical protein